MIAALAALVVSASPAAPLDVFAHDALAAKKKKPKKDDKKKSDEPPPDTSPGLDLSAPAQPEPQPEPPPSDTPKEEVKAEPAKESVAPGKFSVVTPHTVGESGNLIEAGVGWPGVYAAYWRGILTALDVGARVGFNWSFEGQVTRVTPGLHVQLQARYLFFDNGKISVGATLAPGLLVYFLNRPLVGLIIPVTAVAGYQLMEKLNVGVMLEVPFWVLFGFGAVLPVTLGAGGEYYLTDSLALQARVKAGPSVWLNGGGVYFMFEALVGAAYRL